MHAASHARLFIFFSLVVFFCVCLVLISINLFVFAYSNRRLIAQITPTRANNFRIASCMHSRFFNRNNPLSTNIRWFAALMNKSIYINHLWLVRDEHENSSIINKNCVRLCDFMGWLPALLNFSKSHLSSDNLLNTAADRWWKRRENNSLRKGAQCKSSQLDFYAILLQNYCYASRIECGVNAVFGTIDYIAWIIMIACDSVDRNDYGIFWCIDWESCVSEIKHISDELEHHFYSFLHRMFIWTDLDGDYFW